MQGNEQATVVLLKSALCAVTVVNVPVEHTDSIELEVLQGLLYSNCHIGEEAETRGFFVGALGLASFVHAAPIRMMAGGSNRTEGCVQLDCISFELYFSLNHTANGLYQPS